MIEQEAASLLAGAMQVEGAQSSSPTNLHVITAEVMEDSTDGKALVSIDGLVFSEDDSQYIEINTIGGLKEGDITTVVLAGQEQHAMVPLAIGAVGSVDRVAAAAEEAERLADIAKEAADQAVSDAADAAEAAASAKEAADQAVSDAADAAKAADQAASDADAIRSLAEESQGDAKLAKEWADRAVSEAVTARKGAEEASAAAAIAQASADTAIVKVLEANSAAMGATTSLGVVEDVLGTLNWLREHGTYNLSEDTTVVGGTTYYARNGDAYSIVLPEGNENPSEEGWYVLDIQDALGDYVSEHLALITGNNDEHLNGLHVIPMANGYYTVLSTKGMGVYNPSGVLVGWYGEASQMGSIYGTHMEASGERLSFFSAGFTYPRCVETSDTEIVANKVYYTTSSTSVPYIFTVVDPVGDKNPSEEGWYESSISNGYIDYGRANDGKFDGEVAYIAIDENGQSVFYMYRAVVVSELRFGDWEWFERSNRNLSLKWIGA